MLCDRDNGIVRVRGDDRTWSGPYPIRPYDSMLSEFADPPGGPEVLRCASGSAPGGSTTTSGRTRGTARASQIGTRTPVIGQDGADVAAALQTIRETGDADALDPAVDLAFPGSRVNVDQGAGGSGCGCTSTACSGR